jgi:V/A-type H+/Na+-transporting ATPase subunit D
MARMLRVRPTKIELVKLQRRLALSQRVKKILKDRLAILTTEFIETARRAIVARDAMAAAVARATAAAGLAGGYHGAVSLAPALLASEADVAVVTASRNVAGARLPSLALELPETALPPYDLLRSSALVDEAAAAGREALPAIIALAELERALEILGAEIQRTKRISNALEYLVVPSLERTIRALSMKFEERDREEKARLKHIKVLRAHQAPESRP